MVTHCLSRRKRLKIDVDPGRVMIGVVILQCSVTTHKSTLAKPEMNTTSMGPSRPVAVEFPSGVISFSM